MTIQSPRKITKILVANRGEIAIRVFRAANESGIRTVAIYAEEDKLSLHRFKADESYLIGTGMGPVRAYLSIDEILRVARQSGADAIHPGYGFLSENPEFAEACAEAGLIFIGPPPEVMRSLGNKVSARAMAEAADVPVMPATGPLPEEIDLIRPMAEKVGYPLMLKASWGGGGRGMRVINTPDELERQVSAGRREAEAAFGNGEVYLEKLVLRARHVEVQLLGDHYGTVVHLFERDCSVQRRNQKVVERAPAPYLTPEKREEVCEAALRLARAAGYVCAGTAEFLMDADTGDFHFIEVNPRIQVEHTVTEEVTGIDLVKAQIRICEGGHIGVVDETGVPAQADLRLQGHAIQCRITTEDPEANFIPDYGRITAYRGATGFGIRLDGGTAYSGAVITRYYDSLLEKVTAWAPTPKEAIDRLDRALREFRIRGVATNLAFVENLINHPKFREASYTTRFIDETPELFHFDRRLDRATKLLRFIADVTVNGNPEVKGRVLPTPGPAPHLPFVQAQEPPRGTRQILAELGPTGFAEWMLDQKRTLVTDTTFRDAHQSLLATRMRSFDMIQVADAYARNLPELFSLECWGGATFDVAMRFLRECPWERLAELRQRVPNILFQMLLRGANGVGYTVYPDNVVKGFTHKAAEAGVDLFRVFDSLNWVENMRVSMDAVLETGKLLEGVVCYTGDINDPERSKYDLKYYVSMARELRKAGSHIIGIKDMAGLVKPRAAYALVKALKEETGLPVHFHTHDTSGISAASVLEAVRAGVDAIDAAMDSFSGLTSQPCLGSIVEALRFSERDTGLDPLIVRQVSDYWEGVRRQYAGFESDLRSGASEVYLHEMPGGQFTNLKEQARAMGLAGHWHEVARTYAEVNQMFGDIVKVTPSSKVVGDMALYMVGAGLTRADVEDPDKDVSFPDSVVSLMRGELGHPPEGFPEALQRKVLRGQAPLSGRPGATVPPADLAAERKTAEEKAGRAISDEEFQSYLMYPKVFIDYAKQRAEFGPVRVLPTPIFFYGMKPGQETAVTLEAGKTLVIRCQALGETDEEGMIKVFFELNGQPRVVRVVNRAVKSTVIQHEKADPANPTHVACPMPGLVSSVGVSVGQTVRAGDPLLTIEAMKMETSITAERAGVIERLPIAAGTAVEAKDLLVVYKG
ncbi:pyruvate carboxylase [Rhodospirillum rubrum]|uniref:pyruvate carboxylase n=1 Tax=Rhodospirillum rubrum TaxID=1085 RepID=UPI0019058928|nr:pyruvate carboxylase [Rhodospirillum rubrum]MBK1664300.1 pyruvate carboxylase [Rhodospirillum rubrum]MBK1675905.1 pyruvate carboxylase [Rhodospirillum rubrum]